MTFRAYLMVRPDGSDAAGDFVRLARAHGTLSSVRSAQELRARLEDVGVPTGLYEAAQRVWADYQRAPDASDP